ncbi:SMP-30/gluconolactonase/LRE family protein [Neorhizobium sp. DT-125]|uniref:SMP-30/gluconolactonase/LRE family protein n=1 Tax=Neorhizobium sp. DT-125 TaxID=3396163 RepID=UPI003F1D1F47
MIDIFDTRRCELGEGAFWHPERRQFFWFDITGKALLSLERGEEFRWQFDECVSAAGWVSKTELLVASETGLWSMDLDSGSREMVAEFPSQPHLRSNDGRADPWGGFWIGTMGKRSEHEAGAIWRYYRGEMRKLYPGISIPNAICFNAGRSLGYFADTRLRRVWSVRLDQDGWPAEAPELFLDLAAEGVSPDGAVTDCEGNFWNAQWGASRVACYAPDGGEIAVQRFDAARISCPAFGGADLDMLFATSAQQGMTPEARLAEPYAGMTFCRRVPVKGVEEYRVLLG